MSSSFRTTIGWGMPWLEFESLTTLDCEAHATREALDEAFTKADPGLFAIDEAEFERAWFGSEQPRAVYNTQNSLYSNFLVHEGDTFELGRADELFQVIDATEDEIGNHVVFYPDCYHARRWKRTDDEIDLALLFHWEKGGSRDVEPDGSYKVQYVGYGHGAWKNTLMTENGEPFDWMSFTQLRKRPDIVPRVPLEMRSYLTRVGILDDSGVNRLRPLTARWIS